MAEKRGWSRCDEMLGFWDFHDYFGIREGCCCYSRDSGFFDRLLETMMVGDWLIDWLTDGSQRSISFRAIHDSIFNMLP